ncbi:MAG: HAD hydrolase-like protein [Thermomicrobium sp.]|nr:HAD hydrolase-like protein [Thermomicrobium sp.]MDW7982129.1 HAD hydrolase-like protein [Thermomicrobium sp.]
MTVVVLFDIDGTLLRAGDPAHAEAMLTALSETLGRPVALDGVPLAGMLDRQIARLALQRYGLDDATIERSLPTIMQRMADQYRQRVRRGDRRTWVLPGVPALLSELWRRGVLAGVLTGNAEGVARAKLAAAHLETLLPFGAYGDQADERHLLVEHAQSALRTRYGIEVPRSRIVLVGDTPRDVAAAREAGARVLAVATGRFSMEQLLAVGAHAALPDLADVEHACQLLTELVHR